jgi:hypothetical protein
VFRSLDVYDEFSLEQVPFLGTTECLAKRSRSGLVFTFPSFTALTDRQPRDPQGGERISPPPANRRIEHQTGEQDRREPRAQKRLRGVGDQNLASEFPRNALRSRPWDRADVLRTRQPNADD